MTTEQIIRLARILALIEILWGGPTRVFDWVENPDQAPEAAL